MELKINKEYEKILPKLSAEEYEALKESISEQGLLYPIIINQDNEILDGHNRYKACKETGVELKTQVKEFTDKLVEKRFVIETNLKRRHLNAYQKVEMGMVLWEIEKELAKQRHGRGLKLAPGEAGFATDKVAKQIGVSGTTFERAKKVIENASESVKEKLRSTEWTINYAYTGYNLLDDVIDEEKQGILKERFEADEINPGQMKKIVDDSVMALETLASTTDKISKQLKADHEDKFWSEDFDWKQFDHDRQVLEGEPVTLKVIEISKERLATKEEAEAFAKKVGGSVIGETTYWKMKVDPLKYKEE